MRMYVCTVYCECSFKMFFSLFAKCFEALSIQFKRILIIFPIFSHDEAVECDFLFVRFVCRCTETEELNSKRKLNDNDRCVGISQLQCYHITFGDDLRQIYLCVFHLEEISYYLFPMNHCYC